MLSSISTLPFSPHLSSAQLPSSNFLSPPVAALVHYSTAIILTPRTMKFPPFPTSLGTLITFQRISLMSYLIMKIGATPPMRTISSLLPLLVPVIQNSPTLSVWCPEDSADPSPDHSITICNSSDSPFSCSGPSLSLADWHSALPTGRTVWQCSHTHSPNSALLSYLFPRLLQCWLAFWSLEKLPFGEAVKNSFSTLIANPSPAIAAWRFPPHSLSLNTIRTLLHTFARQSFCIEGFGYGCYSPTHPPNLYSYLPRWSRPPPLHLPLTRCLPFRPLSRLPQRVWGLC